MNRQFIMKLSNFFPLAVILCSLTSGANAALTIDRARIILNEEDNAVSPNIRNNNTKNPFLAQIWFENNLGEKISTPLIALPPLQRIEPGGKTKVRIQAISGAENLPKDRESVFWLNLREIPTVSDKKNVLSLVMQSRLKVFYRPAALKVDIMEEVVPGADKLTLIRQGNTVKVKNPTPYNFTFVEARTSDNAVAMSDFAPVMVAPKSEDQLNISSEKLGNTPTLLFVNDFGSKWSMAFKCAGTTCQVEKVARPSKK